MYLIKQPNHEKYFMGFKLKKRSNVLEAIWDSRGYASRIGNKPHADKVAKEIGGKVVEE